MPKWTSSETTDFILAPEGTYNAKVGKRKISEDGLQVSICWELLDGTNRHWAWQNFSFNEKSEKYLNWQLGVLGLKSHLKKMAEASETKDLSWTDSALLSYNWLGEFKGAAKVAVTHRKFTNKDGQEKTVADVIIKDVLPDLNEVGLPNYANPPTVDGEELPF